MSRKREGVKEGFESYTGGHPNFFSLSTGVLVPVIYSSRGIDLESRDYHVTGRLGSIFDHLGHRLESEKQLTMHGWKTSESRKETVKIILSKDFMDSAFITLAKTFGRGILGGGGVASLTHLLALHASTFLGNIEKIESTLELLATTYEASSISHSWLAKKLLHTKVDVRFASILPPKYNERSQYVYFDTGKTKIDSDSELLLFLMHYVKTGKAPSSPFTVEKIRITRESFLTKVQDDVGEQLGSDDEDLELEDPAAPFADSDKDSPLAEGGMWARKSRHSSGYYSADSDDGALPGLPPFEEPEFPDDGKEPLIGAQYPGL
jgi:hypothetical protein